MCLMEYVFMEFYGILGLLYMPKYCTDLCPSENIFFIQIPHLAFEKL